MLRRTPWTLSLCLLTVANLQAAAPKPPQQKGTGALPASGEVQGALEAELAGDNAARNSALAARLAANPDDAATRWHSGQVRVGKEWVPYDRVADQGDRWHELYRYREERAKKKQTIQDQLFLADGSREHKLADEERAHLTQVVVLAAGHIEAHSRLGDIPTQGTWISREAAERTVRNTLRGETAEKQYGERATRFVQRLRQRSAGRGAIETAAFDAWHDPEAIPSLERAIGDRGDAAHVAYVQWLGEFPCYEASQALVRQSLFSEQASIRVSATATLKSRPLEDYMRDLVASITVLRPTSDPQTLSGRGAHLASYSIESMGRRLDVQFLLLNPIDGLVERRRQVATRSFEGFIDFHEATGAAAAQIWQAEAIGRAARDQVRSDRALRIVSEVSGKPATTANEAWAWWADVNDGAEAKEIVSLNYEQPWYVDRRTRRVQPAPYQTVDIVRPHSCLAAGTPVLTETGARPIEEIEIGDRILAQDIESGELAYKPVLARTSRDNGRLTRLKTAADDIVCSQGHPFWVNGMGWVQARHLRPGLPLHTVQGSLDVVSTEPAGTGTVFNLVVADSHSYFVGKSQAFLSHDVTPRDPTNAIVPGLQPLWLAPEGSEDETPVTVR